MSLLVQDNIVVCRKEKKICHRATFNRIVHWQHRARLAKERVKCSEGLCDFYGIDVKKSATSGEPILIWAPFLCLVGPLVFMSLLVLPWNYDTVVSTTDWMSYWTRMLLLGASLVITIVGIAAFVIQRKITQRRNAHETIVCWASMVQKDYMTVRNGVINYLKKLNDDRSIPLLHALENMDTLKSFTTRRAADRLMNLKGGYLKQFLPRDYYRTMVTGFNNTSWPAASTLYEVSDCVCAKEGETNDIFSMYLQ